MNQGEQPKRKRKCIVTFARSWHALAATRSLGRHGIDVITGDTNPMAAASLSRYSKDHFTYPNPDEDPEGFIDTVVGVAERHHAPDTDLVVMPIHMCTYAVICYRERFDGLAKMALPTKEQFEIVGNKTNLMLFCQQHNVRTPASVVVNKPEYFPYLANKFTYPSLLKVPTSTASIGLHEVRSPERAIQLFDEVIKKYDLNKPGFYPILQKKVGGEDYCSTFLFDHGELFPKGSGMGAVRETVDAPKMEEVGAFLLRKLKWHGVAQIDFRWDGSSEPWLIEMNPRFWGGLAQSIESGFDYPYWLYQLALDGQSETFNPERRNVRTWNPGLVLLLAIQEFLESKHSKLELAVAYEMFKMDFRNDQIGATYRLLEKVSSSLNPQERLAAVKKVLRKEYGGINEFFSFRDPLPMLGLLYPIMLFVRHGKISPELLVAKAKIDHDKPQGS